MKKKILSVTLLVTILLTLALAMTGCGIQSVNKIKTATHSFDYSHCYTSDILDETKGLLQLVYVDTILHLYADGTWTIDMNEPTILIDNAIDKGTYTLSGSTYHFEGFEYDLTTTGRITSDGFEIYFKDPTGTSENAMILYFVK